MVDSSAKYPNSDILTEADANVGSSKNKTRAVGGYAPNGYGLHDMAGNTWEACWDWYDKDYYATFTETAINPPVLKRVICGSRRQCT